MTIDHSFDGRMSVVSDNITGISELLHYVYDRGHRRIAYIHGLSSAVTQNRLLSFYRTLSELGLDVPDEYVVEAPYRDSGKALERTHELLTLPDPPTCIFYPDDFAALGLSIPGDISIVGYDGIRISRHLAPHLVTYRQNMERIGQIAAEKLIAQIEQPKLTVPERITVSGEVYEGDTVRTIS